MLGESHILVEEFPEHREKIYQMKSSDNAFARLFDEYHGVNAEIIDIEEHNSDTSDFYLEELKKKRLQLKDQLYSLLIK